MRGYNLSPRMAEEVAKVVRDYMNQSLQPSAKKGFKRERSQQEDIVQVKCTVAIPAATDSFATPSTSGKAKFQVSDSSGVLSDYAPEIEVDVINHSESDSWAVDDYLKIHFIDGRWHPYTGNGGGAICCQVAGEVYDLLTSSNTPASGARVWSNECDGGQLPPMRAYFRGTADAALPGGASDVDRYYRNRNEGHIEWTPAAEVRLVFDPESGRYKYSVPSGEITLVDGSGVDLTGSETYSVTCWEDPNGVAGAWVEFNATQTGVVDIDTSVAFVAGSSPRPDYTKSVTYGIGQYSSNWEGVVPGPLGLCSKPSTQSIDLGEIILSIVPTVTVIGIGEYTVKVEFTVENTSSESITVTFDPTYWLTGSFQAYQFNSSFTFSVSAGTTSSLQTAMSTTTVYHPFSNGEMLTWHQGQVTGVGDSTSTNYTSNTDYVETRFFL